MTLILINYEHGIDKLRNLNGCIMDRALLNHETHIDNYDTYIDTL